MKKGDLITIALLMVNLISVGLILANIEFAAAPANSSEVVQPVLVSPTPGPATVSPTPSPSPTMVLAINEGAVLNAPITVGAYVVSKPSASPTIKPTPTPTPTPKITATPSPTKKPVPTTRPSASPTTKSKIPKKHWHRLYNN